MKIRTIALTAVCASLLGGCATKEYVNEQVAGVNKRMDARDAQYQALEGRVNSQQGSIDGLSRTVQEALDRANAAGKLAAGKFLYETVLTSQVAKFKFDSSELSPDMKAALDAFSDKLKADNKNVYVEIQGHTDSVGTDSVNLKVGQDRAEAVRRYLSTKGIPLHRLGAVSYGESAPVASNTTAAGRGDNRRVSLVVLQ